MFFASFFRVPILQVSLLHGPTSNWRNPQQQIVFTLLSYDLHVRKHVIFHNIRDMFRCSLLHHLLLHVAPMLASFWYDFGIKT